MSEHLHLEETTPWMRRWLRADISMAGYLGGNHIGAIAYNLAHNWFTGGVVFALGAALEVNGLAMAGAILVAHTGIDRVLGYGLKYPTAFQDTHLGRIGRR